MGSNLGGIDWQSLDWGNVPTWVSIVVAALAARFALANLRTAQKTFERNSQNMHREQARKVFTVDLEHVVVLPGQPYDPLPSSLMIIGFDERREHDWSLFDLGPEAESGHTGEGFGYRVFGIKNASDEPIYDPEISVHWETEVSTWQSPFRRVVMPGDVAEFPLVYALEDQYTVNAIVSCSFRDAKSVRWKRSAQGVLEDEESLIPRSFARRVFDAWLVIRGARTVR